MVVSATKALKWHLRGQGFAAVYFPLLIAPSSRYAPQILCYFHKMGPYSLISKAHEEISKKV